LNANNSTSLNRWAGQQHWYLQHRVPSTPSIRTCHWYGGWLENVYVYTTAVGVAFKLYPYAGGTSICFQTQSLCWWSLLKAIPMLVAQTPIF